MIPAGNLSEPTAVYPHRWRAFAVLCFSLLVIVMDNTILNVALPTLARDLSATASQLQWVVDAYVLVFAGMLLTAGSLGDRFGRRRALSVGMLVFAAGSTWAAYAGSAGQLIAARALMGVSAALIMPATLSITANIFPPKERAKAVGMWAGVAGLGFVLGPVSGGWLLERFWWGSVFLINLPFLAFALVAGYLLVPESKDPNASPLDPAGALLSIAGLTALLYGIIEVPARGWTDGAILVAFGAAAVLLAAFAAWELRSRSPMLDMRLFRNMRFTGASLAITLVFFAMLGSLFFLTQYLQFVLGYTALQAGIRLMPLAVGMIIAAPLSARLTARFGTKLVVAAGMVGVAKGLAWLSFVDATSGYGLVATGLFIMGAGIGTAMAPATDSIMGSLPLAKAGVGSAVNDTTRQVGGALGVAVLGSILSAGYRSTMEGASEVHALPAQAMKAATDSVGAATEIAGRLGGVPGEALRAAANAAFIDAMGTTVLVAAGVALLGSLVALFFLPARSTEEEAGPVETEPAQPLQLQEA